MGKRKRRKLVPARVIESCDECDRVQGTRCLMLGGETAIEGIREDCPLDDVAARPPGARAPGPSGERPG